MKGGFFGYAILNNFILVKSAHVKKEKQTG